jgi:hypothetical protein
VQADWVEVSLEDQGWKGNFDLAFAHMTPAIQTPASFLKLVAASRGWCLYSSWAGRRENPLMDMLGRELGAERREGGVWNLLLAFNLLFSTGITADVEFESVSYESREPVEQSIAFFTEFYSGFLDSPRDELESRISGFLRPLAEDGTVGRKTAGNIGTMTWRIADVG